VFEFQLRRDIAALTTRILNMRRAIRKNRLSGANPDALESDNARLRHMMDVRGFKEGLLNKTIREHLNASPSETVAL